MTGLLVSVRDATEALAALEGGADLIDIKEPRLGSLGAADVRTWRAIADVVGQARPLSVALGELHQRNVGNLARQAAGMQFAKIGLSACSGQPHWNTRWQEAMNCLPHGIASVAVVYADHAEARAPQPSEVLRHAIQLGCKALLFDTHSKSHGHLFDFLDARDLLPLIRDAKHAGLKTVLGGSLRGALVTRALELEPDYIAVRGAVCHGDRRGSVQYTLIESLARIVHACSPAGIAWPP